MGKLEIIKDNSTDVEVVSLENINYAYPEHTHIGHSVMGIVTDGKIAVQIGKEEFEVCEGEYFSVAVNTAHSIRPISETYSMLSTCIPEQDGRERELEIIRNQIMGDPELELCIADMAEKVHVSKYHMIRKFAGENGITPHKFQLQCKIRKAQHLLAEGMRVVDVAEELGFCDQSHFDREFKKQWGISPDEYVKTAILSKP